MIIKGWRAFRLTDDGLLKACHRDTVYEGPIARTRKPWSELQEELILADPAAAVRKMGENALKEWYRSKPPLCYDAWQQYTEPTGFHAWKSKEAGLNYCGESGFPVLGEVDLFGFVVEHELGYRSEAMRIMSLWIVDPKAEPHIPALASRYHCEVTPCTSDERSKSTRSNLTSLIGQMTLQQSLQQSQLWMNQQMSHMYGSPLIQSVPSPRSWFQRVVDRLFG